MEVNSSDFSPASSGSKKFKFLQDKQTNIEGISNCVVEPVNGDFKCMAFESIQSADHNASNSLSFLPVDDDNLGDAASDLNDDNGEYLFDDNDDEDDDEDDDYDYGADDYLELQAQFDNADLPPGVEASVPWLMDVNPPDSSKGGTEKANGASCSRTSEPKNKGKYEEQMDDVLRKLMYFKRFDIVEDLSDHHFKDLGLVSKPPKSWAKKIQDEWRILEDNLPDTIFVRAYESRMEFLRAAIIGPDGTPYHDGLFFFDIMFPSSYPNDPPLVHYHSGGLRLNPNLYHCGKVCLSLLGTWAGKSSEIWLPDKSTMLQVLVSIQALILNSRPFFNEPGYEKTYRGEEGEKRSRNYNEQVFLYSLKTMMYSLKHPPQHFHDLVAGHFRIRAADIMTACRVYSEGAEVGTNIKQILKQAEKIEDDHTAEFKESLAAVAKNLAEYLVKNGSKDLDVSWIK